MVGMSGGLVMDYLVVELMLTSFRTRRAPPLVALALLSYLVEITSEREYLILTTSRCLGGPFEL